jgi:hypothetical protein
MDLAKERFVLATNMNNLTYQQNQEILAKIEEAFPLIPSCIHFKFNPKYTR